MYAVNLLTYNFLVSFVCLLRRRHYILVLAETAYLNTH